MAQKRILLITTGGTISGKVAIYSNEGVEKTGLDFKESLEIATQTFSNNWNIDIELTTKEVCNIDSSNMKPEIWSQLGDIIKEEYDNYEAFIVIHGTNTLGYTAAGLTFSLPNINKPVILTGSQVPFGYLGSDAVTNLVNSMRIASWEYHPMKGIMAVFGSQIITGVRVKKGSDFDYDPFQSFSTHSIGQIGRLIKINTPALEKHLEYLRKDYSLAISAKQLQLINKFDPSIASFTEFPGMDPKLFQTVVEHNGVKGIVFRAFGAGDASEHLREGFEYLKANKIPIIVTSQAPKGNANFQVNKPGMELKEFDLAIPAYDMSIETMTVKMSWLLGQGMSYREIKREMLRDHHGEVNVVHDMR